jgi:hypothetical protein
MDMPPALPGPVPLCRADNNHLKTKTISGRMSFCWGTASISFLYPK